MATKDAPKGRDVWVGPNPDAKGQRDKWQVKEEGAKAPIATFPRQVDAIDAGRPRAERNGSELVIQRPDGRIRDKDSHGDESPAPDKRGKKK